MCDDGWDDLDATVVCRKLQYSRFSMLSYVRYSMSAWQLKDVTLVDLLWWNFSLFFSKSIIHKNVPVFSALTSLCIALDFSINSTCRSSAKSNYRATCLSFMGHVMFFLCISIQTAQAYWVHPLAKERAQYFWIMWPVLVQRTHLKTALMIPVLLTAPIMRMLPCAAAFMVKSNIVSWADIHWQCYF